MKRLLDVLAAFGDHTEKLPSGALCVFWTEASKRQYWGLADWAVSSVCGPVYIMVPR